MNRTLKTPVIAGVFAGIFAGILAIVLVFLPIFSWSNAKSKSAASNANIEASITKEANASNITKGELIEYPPYYENRFKIVPKADSDWYSYSDLDSITDETTLQYALKSTYWCNVCGLYCHDYDYVVAMGEGYAKVGDRFRIGTLNGSYTVFVGDVKKTTDTKKLYTSVNLDNGSTKVCVIEFLADTDKLSDEIINTGNVGSGCEWLSGKIVAIEKLS